MYWTMRACKTTEEKKEKPGMTTYAKPVALTGWAAFFFSFTSCCCLMGSTLAGVVCVCVVVVYLVQCTTM
ncbi:hypothetical protein F4809DRAFT_592747 [Biscogniauxia mediterranea]|nr:hypothetical protein F4809DRAFT_592747 [Biscogniauxia mediterranea]